MSNDLGKAQFEKSYERPNLILACRGYCHQYGDMDQEMKLGNILAADQSMARQLPRSISWTKLNVLSQDYRLWFVMCEWLKHGVFTDTTCVYYQRKFQNSDQAVDELKKIALKYDAELFGYPDLDPSKRFIVYPRDRKESTLRAIKREINEELHQWSYRPAGFSDIRTWPLRYSLLDKDCQRQPCCPPIGYKCLPEAW